MLSTPTILTPKNTHYPSALMGAKEGSLFPRIWSIGNLDLLKSQLLGLFCSVRCPGDLILRTYDLARPLRDVGVPVISGFHTPIEKDFMGAGKSLYTFETQYNKSILDIGAMPVDTKLLAQWAASLNALREEKGNLTSP